LCVEILRFVHYLGVVLAGRRRNGLANEHRNSRLRIAWHHRIIVWSEWWSLPVAIACGILLAWLLIVAVLFRIRPDAANITQALRLLPDLVRLFKRLVADPSLPRGIRLRVGLLLAYLALPVDLIPDFVPVLGYADDAIVIAVVLRSVSRRAGPEVLAAHWPGTPEGLAAVKRICGLTDGTASPP
jgi:uncharacterized membrane protein YkvA (DUF1232 family)